MKRHLTKEAQDWLTREVTFEEIKRALFNMHPDKAPGPDGYNAGFFQQNWELVSPDKCAAVANFFQHGKLLKQISHTFVTLIPKTSNASQDCLIIGQYRAATCYTN